MSPVESLLSRDFILNVEEQGEKQSFTESVMGGQCKEGNGVCNSLNFQL